MKKLFSAILAGLMLTSCAFGFSGCGKTEENNENAGSKIEVDVASLGLMGKHTDHRYGNRLSSLRILR